MLNVARISNTLYRPAFHFKYGAAMTYRLFSMHRINENLFLCTDKPRKIDIDKNSLRFTQIKENKKPLVVLFAWVYSQQNHVEKYIKLYTDQGLDVLVAQFTLWQFLVSVKDTEQFAKNIMDIVMINEDQYKNIFLQIFSAGGGLWGTIQRLITKDPKKYWNIPDRVIGQVWDSPANLDKIPVAISRAVAPKNKILKAFVSAILWTHLTLHRPLHHHYVDAINRSFQNMARAPALIFTSHVDPVGTEAHNRKIAELWRNNGMDVTLKCFENSDHVKHFQTYPEEYLKLIEAFWDKVKLSDEDDQRT